MRTWQEYLGEEYTSGITLIGVFPEEDFQKILSNIYQEKVGTEIQELADDSLGYIGLFCDLEKLEQKSLKVLIEKFIRLKMFERHESYMTRDDEKVVRLEKEFTTLLKVARDTQENNKTTTTTNQDDKSVSYAPDTEKFTEEFWNAK